MSSVTSSRVVGTLEQGLVLEVTIEDLQFRSYVVVSAPDIERVADFVPAEQFEQDGDVHVTAVSHPDEARTQVEDLAFNMNLGDAAVFLCGNQAVYERTLEELGFTAV
ncbi:hypothetical protein [Allopusillimonas ginsengisoli]|uniref:hypothetical protein n=1 Tax=Allopusillimonas ginsengisoli TaxID=453575 RepID=UPI00101F13E4|nr:hypothetical protein [Allopusillimonas ginsengisoli]TEA77676.1 hypothetical protein ERE07_13645 [Allopusillimonas ginsengisoli]